MKPCNIVLLLVALVLSTGCASESIVATAEPFCAAVKHVCISRDDRLTEGTAQQLEANNLGRKPICPLPKGEDPCGGQRQAPASKPAAVAKPAVDKAPARVSALSPGDPVAEFEPLPLPDDLDKMLDGVRRSPPPQVDADRARRVAAL